MFLLSALTPADRALLLAVRPPPRNLDCLSGLDETGWQALVARAASCNLAPLLFYNLRQDGYLERAPAAVRQRLAGEYYASVRRQLLFAAELKPALAALQQQGITPLLLKGVVLAATAYPDMGLRPMTDVDLMVRAADMPAVPAALKPLDYYCKEEAAAVSGKYFNGELSFAKGTHEETFALEFHQDLVHSWNFSAPLRLNTAGFWRRARPFALDEQTVAQLAAEDMLLHLCLHRAMHHGFSGLPGYVDIAWAIHTWGNRLDWAAVVDRAAAFEAGTAVFVALQLAHDLVGAAVPETVLKRLGPQAWRRQLLARLVDLDLVLKVDVAPAEEDAGRVLNVAVIDSLPGLLRWIRMRLFPGVDWQKANYALESNLLAYVYALALHPLKIVGGFVGRAARLAR